MNGPITFRENARADVDPMQGIFTSQFNRIAGGLVDEAPVWILDTTLRDGEQTPGIALSIDQKIQIAQALDELGVDVIEAGFPITSNGEAEAVKRVASLGLNARVCGLARCRKEDIDAVLGCGVDYVHTFIATSDTHLKYKLKMTRDQVMEKAVSMIEYAKDHGATVEFSCEDATRTDLEFLKAMHVAVQEAGVDRINVPDTVGVIAPSAMEYLIGELMTVTKVPIAVHCHDDFGLAVANSLAAVQAGARQVHVCVNGLGERAGNAALEEVVMGLLAFQGRRTNVHTEKIGSVSKTVSRITGYPIPHNKAVVGNNAFAHESGIHVHGVQGDPSTYEAFSPELVGMHRNIVMGKHSGAHSVKEKLKEMGMDLPPDQLTEVVEAIKHLAESGKEVDEAELVALSNAIAGMKGIERMVSLEEFAVFTGANITPTAMMALNIDGEVHKGSEIGIGPVDAALKAIKSVAGDMDLEEYRLDAITGGSDSLCEVTISLRDDRMDKRSVGRSVGADIIQTSVEAAIEAVNRLFISRKG